MKSIGSEAFFAVSLRDVTPLVDAMLVSFDYNSDVTQVEPKETRKLLQYLDIATRSNRESMVNMFVERLLSAINYDCGMLPGK